MKVVIESEDADEIKTLMNATSYELALYEMGSQLRTQVKHGDRSVAKFEDIYERYFEILDSYGLSRDDIGF